ncbi:MAG: NAD kinase [Quadrisphaera sp.]
MRRVLVLTHTGRQDAVDAARQLVALLDAAGVEPVLLDDEAADIPDCTAVRRVQPDRLDGLELVVVVGGDGTVLRGAELVHGTGVPLLGVNLGRVGFLAEIERDALESTVTHVAARDYGVEERLTLQVDIVEGGVVRATSWALNDVSVEKGARERVLELATEVDGRPVSTYGCDGVVMATPTGSTAYAFSAGGPVVWPGVEALLMVPISAHALFARPLVVSPDSVMAVEVLERNQTDGVVWCDGRRSVQVRPGARIEVRRGAEPVRLAHISTGPFTDRLVAKFGLAVGGWRGPDDTTGDGAQRGFVGAGHSSTRRPAPPRGIG